MSDSSYYQQLALFAAVATGSAIATLLVARRLEQWSRRRADQDEDAVVKESCPGTLPRADPFDPRPRTGYGQLQACNIGCWECNKQL